MDTSRAFRAVIPNCHLLPPEILELVQRAPSASQLQTISDIALQPQFADVFLTSLKPLLPDICARWINNEDIGRVIAGFGRMLPFAPYLADYVHLLLDRRTSRQSSPGFLAAGGIDIQNASEGWLCETLLGLFRLLVVDNEGFGRYVHATEIQLLLKHESSVVRYVAARTLCLYLHAADAATMEIISKYLGNEYCGGLWEGKEIDYRFLSLWEEWRLEDITKQLKVAEQTRKSPSQLEKLQLQWSHLDLSPLVADVSDVLLPRPDGEYSGKGHGTPVVPTPTAESNLRAIAQGLLGSSPLLVMGLAGCGKTLMITYLAKQLNKLDSMITLHLNEQSDAKLLIGMYTTGATPGTFGWKPGVLATAVREGRWVFIEDIDRAPTEIMATLLPLIEHGELTIPERGEVVRAARGFKLIATIRTTLNLRGEETAPGSNMIGRRFWQSISIQHLRDGELEEIISNSCPILKSYVPRIMAVFKELKAFKLSRSSSTSSIAGTLRPITSRDLFKWCQRLTAVLSRASTYSETQLDLVFLEAVDCFGGNLQDGRLREQISRVIAKELHIDDQRRQHLLESREIKYTSTVQPTPTLRVGRVTLKSPTPHKSRKKSASRRPFSVNSHSLRTLERVAVAVSQREPLLLVGETGTGKTSSIQHLADAIGQVVHAFNLSQQSESGDLLGGYKPVNARALFIPLRDEFNDLFTTTFSRKQNQRFLDMLDKCIAKAQWKRVCILWREALRMVDDHSQASSLPGQPLPGSTAKHPKKKRKMDAAPYSLSYQRWQNFATKAKGLEAQVAGDQNTFSFDFLEGNIVKAVREGHWVLLDEINLAAPDTLEAIADLLTSGTNSYPSLLLTERGSPERIEAHPNFRIFAAMNPATDIGKKDLPQGIRSRFTEIFVDSPDTDIRSLTSIVEVYLGKHHVDRGLTSDVAKLHLKILSLAEDNLLVDGAGQKAQFSLRTLTRTLTYAGDMAQYCTPRRALFEGFFMSYLTLLDQASESFVIPVLHAHLFGKHSNAASELKRPLRAPSDGQTYVQHGHHWLRQGSFAVVEQPDYIITPFVRRNLDALVRAASTRRFPILIEGPTSSGKTSMIEYLAKKSGHKFVRINNHEHTDIQEYMGTYRSTIQGKIQFADGILVRALREGHWVVLDELNLAPSDVLEALNRLLDDNKELLVPETQEVVKPHPDFVLFATQNPAGLYGGRKVLSRAFRNRFLELHFSDIPIDELTEILHRRTKIPESWAKRIVAVYGELSTLRQESRLFEQRSFATLRDLFRWAFRQAESVEQLAINGYMLLSERARKVEERDTVKKVIETVMSLRGPRVKINEDSLYDASHSAEMQAYQYTEPATQVVLTRAMRRLFVLVAHALRNNEPVLLIGETGCGKTTVCQMLADAFGKPLSIVNAHQNTETGDLVGAQRPVRNRALIEQDLRRALASCLHKDMESDHLASVGALLEEYDGLDEMERQSISEGQHHTIQHLRSRHKALFEWADGSLVQAMRAGHFFLLDEISLADDSVLERLNSVLESQRTLILAEKGTDDAIVVASEGFQFVATMNPGGDYGKRELSLALRNRFTEIWVPALSEVDDVLQVVQSKLKPSLTTFAATMVSFAQWFNQQYNTSASSSISIRDTLAWTDFINKRSSDDPIVDIIHGAAMTFIDTLGANPAAMLGISSSEIEQERRKCLNQLSKLLGTDTSSTYYEPADILSSSNELNIGGFSVPRNLAAKTTEPRIAFDASTTKMNAMRVLRALQLPKPILIEGNPGVGKTSLITGIAEVIGNPLLRINLSEQTDLMDLFGSDVPVEGAAAGVFAWRDAPFLRAMKNGDWVLLDEMNLASQSILEGLNSCLDHRAEVYVAELDQTFHRHQSFRLFAAQNPHHQGGGRKGLPASFVNRFTVVYADVFRPEDLTLICKRLFPTVSDAELEKLIRFVGMLEARVVGDKAFGGQGAPWEFNLRDILRWLELLTASAGFLPGGSARDFLDTIFTQRFRSHSDRDKTLALFGEIYESSSPPRRLYHNLTPDTYQVGLGTLPRRASRAHCHVGGLGTKTGSLSVMESMLICVQMAWPVVLVGGPGSGKSSAVQHLASTVGSSLVTISMNNDIDAVDIIGGYEQVDPSRSFRDVINDIKKVVYARALAACTHDQNTSPGTLALYDILRLLLASDPHRVDGAQIVSLLQDDATYHTDAEIVRLQERANFLRSHPINIDRAQFEWIDGILVQALERGDWLVLDNANLCNSSVLDRLNSLLEPGGTLIVNERTNANGEPKVVKPHPNFQIFLTMDPRYGELSRAMRNRAVELFLPSESEQGTLPAVSASLFARESLSYRFRNFSRLISQPSSNTAIEHLIDVYLDHLSMIDVEMLISFVNQLNAGLFSSPQSSVQKIAMRSECVGNITRAYFSNGIKLYKELADLGWASTNAQSIQMLNNEPLLRAKHGANFRLSNYAKKYEFCLQLTEMEQAYEAIERAVETTKAITPLERSIALERHPSIHKERSANVAHFLNHTRRAMVIWISSLLSQGKLDLDTLSSMVAFIRLWWGLFKTVSLPELDEATFNIYMSLACDTVSEINPVTILSRRLKEELEKELGIFAPSFRLTTGMSMELLWRQFNHQTLETISRLHNLLRLEGLADKFDAITWRIRTAPGELLRVRRILENSMHLAATQDIVETMPFQDVENIVRNLEANIPQDGHSDNPFFVHEMDGLCQILCISGSPDNVATEPLDSRLASLRQLLACRSTKFQVASTDRAKDKHHLLRFDQLFFGSWCRERTTALPHQWHVSVLERLRHISDVSLDRLDLLRVELHVLGQSVSKHAHTLAVDPVRSLENFLLSLVVEVLLAHSGWLRKSRSIPEVVQFLRHVPKLEQTLQERWTLNNACSDVAMDPNADAILDRLIPPVLAYLSKADFTRQEQTATASDIWISFGLACILLYVPDRPFDPALRPLVERDLFSVRRRDLSEKLTALQTFEDDFTGQHSTLRQRNIEDALNILGTEPAIPPVLRPARSELPRLQGEFSNLLRVVKPIVEAKSRTEFSSQLNSVFEQNVHGVIRRLSDDYRAYDDMTAPAIRFLRCVQLGLDLKHSETPSGGEVSNHPNGFTHFLPLLGNCPHVPAATPDFLPSTEGLNDTETHLLALSFGAVSCSLHPEQSPSAPLKRFCNALFSTLYFQWKERLDVDQKEAAAKSGLYRYRGSQEHEDEHDEEAFRELFPHYDDDVTAPNEKLGASKPESIQARAPELSDVHKLIYLDRGSPSAQLKHLVLRAAKHASERIYNKRSSPSSVDIGSMLPAILLSLQAENQAVHSGKDKSVTYDFYSDSNTEESQKLLSTLDRVRLRFQQIRSAWPDHATPVDVLRLCSELLSFGHREPVAKLLAKAEKLHETVYEWQKVASREHSASSVYEALTDLLISWRKLELKTWSQLFELEIQKCEKDAKAWWFIAYENLIAIPESLVHSGDDLARHAPKLLETLGGFFSSTTFGQYQQRVRLLEQFVEHLGWTVSETPAMEPVRIALANFVAHFKGFQTPVQDALSKGRQALEKNIKNVIMIASWKDRNIDALKQSAKASHKKLFRLVRKFRGLLNQPVDIIIRAGLPEVKDREIALTPLRPITIDARIMQSAQNLCDLHVPRWSERPKRFKNLSVTLSLMDSKARANEGAFDEADWIESFTADLISSATRLQKATPSTLTEENKTAVQHLKSRKRKLFTDALKTLRHMGFKSNLGLDILSGQGNLSITLASLPNLDAHSENCLHKALELMPQVREISREHSADLTSNDVSRSIGLLESILHSCILQRRRLADAHTQLISLKALEGQFEALWNPDEYSVQVESTAQQDNLKQLVHKLSWLPHILVVSAEVVFIQGELGEFDVSSVVQSLRGQAADLNDLRDGFRRLPVLPSRLSSSKHHDHVNQGAAKLQELKSEILQWMQDSPPLGPVFKHILPWTNFSVGQPESIAGQGGFTASSDVGQKMFDAIDMILGAMQDVEKALHMQPQTEEDVGWFMRQDEANKTSIEALSLHHIAMAFENTLSLLHTLDSNVDSGLRCAAAVVATVLPLVQQFVYITNCLVERMERFHLGSTKLLCTLAKQFVHLGRQGFCTPGEKAEEQSGQTEKLEQGTGFGDDEGAEDISKDIQDEDDLGDLADEPNEAGKERDHDIKDEKDAVDMGDKDLGGDMSDVPEDGEEENASSEEDVDNNMDEEAGSVDDLGPSTVDEKMWDEGGKDAEKEMKGNKDKGNEQNDQQAADEVSEDKQGENGADDQDGVESGADEVEDARDEPLENIDPTIQEGETLDVPEDLDFSNDPSSEDSLDEAVEEMDDDMNENGLGENEEGQSEDDGIDHGSEGQESDLDIHGQDGTEEHLQEHGLQASGEDETNLPDTEPGVRDEPKDVDQQGGTGQQTAGKLIEAAAANDVSNEAPEDSTETGPSDPSQEKNAGSSAAKQQGGSESNSAAGRDDKIEDSVEEHPFKKLGDTLEKWYNSQRQIKQSKETEEQQLQNMNQDVDMADADWEHLPSNEATADAQALGVASEEQAKALDNNMEAKGDDAERPIDWMTEDNEKGPQDDVDMEDAGPPPKTSSCETGDGQSSAFVGDRNDDREMGRIDTEDELDDADDEAVEEVDTALSTVDLSGDHNALLQSLDAARSEWAAYEHRTRALALTLTEQLRLILAPTRATKMRGDFRTGKRLNIKRVIPYIASQYRRDKIWMRRTVPSKRAYQILIAVDDSRSMAETGSTNPSSNSDNNGSSGGGDSSRARLAFETLALAAKALTALEAGELCVVGFGERVTVAHPFDAPWTSEAGADVFRRLTFAQVTTDVRRLVAESITLFREARLRTASSAGSADLWQLMLVVSDGICEDHAGIRRLVRQAQEERIMIVFIVVDDARAGTQQRSEADGSQPQQDLGGSGGAQSILDLQTAEFSKDESGAVKLVRRKYMDTFPFRWYLVVRDVTALPGVLSTALRQWFAEVVETAS